MSQALLNYRDIVNKEPITNKLVETIHPSDGPAITARVRLHPSPFFEVANLFQQWLLKTIKKF